MSTKLSLNNPEDHEAIAREIVDSSCETQTVPMAIYKNGTYGICGLGSDNIIWSDDVAVISIPAYYSDINDIMNNLWRDLLPDEGDVSPAAYDLLARELELIHEEEHPRYDSEIDYIHDLARWDDYPDEMKNELALEISNYLESRIDAIAEEDALSHGLDIVSQAVEALADLKERESDNA